MIYPLTRVQEIVGGTGTAVCQSSIPTCPRELPGSPALGVRDEKKQVNPNASFVERRNLIVGLLNKVPGVCGGLRLYPVTHAISG